MLILLRVTSVTQHEGYTLVNMHLKACSSIVHLLWAASKDWGCPSAVVAVPLQTNAAIQFC